MYVLRSVGHDGEAPAPPESKLTLVLRPLDAGGAAERADTPDARFDLLRDDADPQRIEARAGRAGAEVFELVREVMGTFSPWNGYAVTADWQVDDPAREAAFCDSRRRVFEARRDHLRTFAFDWLLRRVDVRGHYVVLGLYGDENDLRQARSHPAVQRIAEAHPPAAFGARDLTGMRFYRVAAVRSGTAEQA